jgi:hypothetical protein
LKETATNHRWEADVKVWLENGRVMDYGHGKQRFLSLKFMKTHILKEPEERKEKTVNISQVGLF